MGIGGEGAGEKMAEGGDGEAERAGEEAGGAGSQTGPASNLGDDTRQLVGHCHQHVFKESQR